MKTSDISAMLRVYANMIDYEFPDTDNLNSLDIEKVVYYPVIMTMLDDLVTDRADFFKWYDELRPGVEENMKKWVEEQTKAEGTHDR